mmetsp:Transcript_18154/g.23888  ORF Transcript_18154/g.23888 Transcript_18154/m.23888 type:complete len:606 (-) Transcript_18154:281-2098(-)
MHMVSIAVGTAPKWNYINVFAWLRTMLYLLLSSSLSGCFRLPTNTLKQGASHFKTSFPSACQLTRRFGASGGVVPNNLPLPPTSLDIEVNFANLLEDELMDNNGSSAAIILLPEGLCTPEKINEWDFPFADVLGARANSRLPTAKKFEGSFLTTELPLPHGPSMTLARVQDKMSTFQLLTLLRQAIEAATQANPTKLMVQCPGLTKDQQVAVLDAVLAGVWAAEMEMPKFMSKSDDKEDEAQKAGKLSSVTFVGLDASMESIEKQQSKSIAAADGTNLARWLATLPSNSLTPSSYREYIKQLTEREGWEFREWDETALEKMGAGAFIAVSQASANRDAAIVRIRKEGPSSKPPIVLVGKGITYDTGGVNIKGAAGMKGMKKDMGGSAVALGTMLALSKLNIDKSIECWMAISENAVGSSAYKPDDVVSAIDGTTIEIVHTDAEGRMVLADTLALASRKASNFIKDVESSDHNCTILNYATLTGSCKSALSSRYSGVFTSTPELGSKLIKIGEESGERVWPFPMDDDFNEDLESDVADTLQCLVGSEADHIYAAKFLARFIKEGSDFVHYDLSSMMHSGSLAHIKSGITGFGVRNSVWFLSSLEED